MSRSSNKKNKVRKISEEEYAKYINSLKSGGRDGSLLIEEATKEDDTEKQSGVS
ncbi:MAG: hypothetical protein IJX81_04265 [Clostridia bacterium]|nr:hypothetical protein [Clostridia bacterium]